MQLKFAFKHVKLQLNRGAVPFPLLQHEAVGTCRPVPPSLGLYQAFNLRPPEDCPTTVVNIDVVASKVP